jgi:hypothetical protein
MRYKAPPVRPPELVKPPPVFRLLLASAYEDAIRNFIYFQLFLHKVE